MKTVFYLFIALVLDVIPALLGLAIFLITAFPGTFGGALIGCAAGNAVAGELGCQVGGWVLGILGTLPIVNTEIAFFTAPIGAVISIVLIGCLNILALAAVLILVLYGRMFYLPYFFMGSIKIVPFINLFPWWTTVMWLSIRRKEKGKEEAKVYITKIKEAEKRSAPGFIEKPPNPDGTMPAPAAYPQHPAPRREDVVPDPRYAPYKQEPAPLRSPNALYGQQADMR